jgi:homoserine dehydrogenase
LLRRKERELCERGIAWRVTGVATRRLGWIADAHGLNVDALPSGTAGLEESHGVRDWLAAARADVLFEATSLSPRDGQPAIDHIRAALDAGAHAITANKGPVVHAYDELRSLAISRRKRFLFESAVMDGTPIFSLFRNSLPALEVHGFRGILNSLGLRRPSSVMTSRAGTQR